MLKAFRKNLSKTGAVYANSGSQAKLKTWIKAAIFCAVLPVSEKSRKGDGAVHFLLLSGGTAQPVLKQTAPALLP